MAASPVPTNMPGTSKPPKRLPGADSQSELRGLELNDEWMIGEPVPRENERHAAVYSVLISKTGQLAEGLEAHVFPLRDIEPKLRKYRQRCIKRMRARTQLKVQFRNVTIVVIITTKTESASDAEHGGELRSLGKDERHETDIATNQIGKVGQKTLFQLELQRIRQSEKRRARQPANTEQGGEKTADEEEFAQKIDTDMRLDVNNEFSLFTSLIQELLDGWDWREISAMYTNLAKNEDSGCLHETYNQYLIQTAAALRKLEEMETYLMVRQREIITLRSLRTAMMR